MVQCPDVELVEPEAVTVKEEKVEPNGSEEEKTEPDVQLIGEDGECWEQENLPRLVSCLPECNLHSASVSVKVWWTVSLLEPRGPSWDIRTASPPPARPRAAPEGG